MPRLLSMWIRSVLPKGALGLILFFLVAQSERAVAQTSWLNSGPLEPYANHSFPQGSPGVESFQAVRAFPHLEFVDPSAMVVDTGSGQVFVSERIGRLYRFTNDEATTEKQLVLDIRENVPVLHDSGLYNFVLDPDFGSNGYLYAVYTWKAADTPHEPLYNFGFNNKYLRLSRFTYDDATGTINPGSELVMIQMRLFNLSHRGGGMLFGEDGFLYVAFGDLNRSSTAQDLRGTLNGGVVRLDVKQQGGSVSHVPRRILTVSGPYSDEISGVGYYIPSDNPFVNPDGSQFEEYFALGCRNPYRMSMDPYTGDIWIGDVGNLWEEINRLENGANFQWPNAEGSNNGNQLPFTAFGHEVPAFYALDRDQSKCLIGGYIYRGNRFPELHGKFLSADYVDGVIWTMELDPTSGTASHAELLGFDQLVSFAEDPANGEIYFFKGNTDGYFDSGIYRLERASAANPIPNLLSETDLFANLATLEPSTGLIEFVPASPLWSDGAVKQRWIGVPNDGVHDTSSEQVAFHASQGYTFPLGTTFVKNFAMEGHRIETRVLVKDEQSDWYGLSYRWREDQSDAELVDAEGLDADVLINNKLMAWRFPSRTECFSCHTDVNGRILGFKTSQLNSDRQYSDGITRNQLAALGGIDLFDVAISATPSSAYTRSVGLYDADASLDHRVRSYLDSNCAQCHQPGGPDGHATWNALLEVPIENRNLVGSPVYEGDANEWLVVPGLPGQSDLLRRMNTLDSCCAMPPLAKNSVDHEAVRQVAAWIRSMDTTSWPGWTSAHVSKLQSAEDIDLSGAIELAIDLGGAGGATVAGVEFDASAGSGTLAIAAAVNPTTEGPESDLGDSPTANSLESLFDAGIGANFGGNIRVFLLDPLQNGVRYKLQILAMDRCCDTTWSASVDSGPALTFRTGEIQESRFDATRAMLLTLHTVGTGQSLEVSISSPAGQVRAHALTLENLGPAGDGDIDVDAIPDFWETFFGPSLSTLGVGDWDGDGINDVGEYQSGTDPTNAADYLKVLSLLSRDATLDVKFRSALGQPYFLETSSNFDGWERVPSQILGNQGETIISIPNDPVEDPELFLRIGTE